MDPLIHAREVGRLEIRTFVALSVPVFSKDLASCRNSAAPHGVPLWIAGKQRPRTTVSVRTAEQVSRWGPNPGCAELNGPQADTELITALVPFFDLKFPGRAR